MDVYFGVDAGPVINWCVVTTGVCELIAYNYLFTQGKPVPAVRVGVKEVQGQLPADVRVYC